MNRKDREIVELQNQREVLVKALRAAKTPDSYGEIASKLGQGAIRRPSSRKPGTIARKVGRPHSR